MGRFSKHEIFRPQKIGAKAARFELPACFFALFGQKVFVVAPFQIARSGQFFEHGFCFHFVFLGQLGGGQQAAGVFGFFIVFMMGSGLGCGVRVFFYDFKGNAHFFADANQALGFFIGILIKLVIILPFNEYAHFIVVNLAETV